MSTMNPSVRAEPFDSAISVRPERNPVKSKENGYAQNKLHARKSKHERKPNGLVFLSALLAVALSTPAIAQKKSADPAKNYPNKPIRWIIDFGSGGLSDTLARIVGMKLTEAWHEPIINQPRPGAN